MMLWMAWLVGLAGADLQQVWAGGTEKELPSAVREVVEKVRPALVMIETWGLVQELAGAEKGSAAGGGRGGRMAAMQALAGPGEAPTTGLLISGDGHILTSRYNLAPEAEVILVTLHDGSRHPAKVLAEDATRQVVMLKIERTSDASWVVPTMVEPKQVKVGQWAVAVGLGLGRDQPVVSVGIVSALGRLEGKALQTDAAVSPANFGGVLANLEGKVLGLCTTPIVDTQTGTTSASWYDAGVGFAIPLGEEAAGSWITSLQQGVSIKLESPTALPNPQTANQPETLPR